mmetsp:Transcript_686/g.1975  ORF Transcript_686/g.1975 Transcript_686/m.1975 type:complete len:245 (+) Transcript_686:3615-4349(+)
MNRANHGVPLLREPLQLAHHGLRLEAIQARRRLIQRDDRRGDADELHRETQPLHLAARNAARLCVAHDGVCALLQGDLCDHGVDLLLERIRVHLRALDFGGKLDGLAHRQMRKKQRRLRHVRGNMHLGVVPRVRRPPIPAQRARNRHLIRHRDMIRQNIEQRGLPRAGRAHDGEHLPREDLARDVCEDGFVLEWDGHAEAVPAEGDGAAVDGGGGGGGGGVEVGRDGVVADVFAAEGFCLAVGG